MTVVATETKRELVSRPKLGVGDTAVCVNY